MGVVYDALEENLDRRVALKVIAPMFADDPDFRERFGREARSLASLDSPHVVQVYAHGEEDGYLYIATQLIPDGDLGQMISQWGPAPVGKAVELMEQVASGLADAHASRLVHRDIKPANVLVRRRGSGATASVPGLPRRLRHRATRRRRGDPARQHGGRHPVVHGPRAARERPGQPGLRHLLPRLRALGGADRRAPPTPAAASSRSSAVTSPSRCRSCAPTARRWSTWSTGSCARRWPRTPASATRRPRGCATSCARPPG